MKKISALLAILVALSGCSSNQPAPSATSSAPSATSSAPSATSSAPSSAVSSSQPSSSSSTASSAIETDVSSTEEVVSSSVVEIASSSAVESAPSSARSSASASEISAIASATPAASSSDSAVSTPRTFSTIPEDVEPQGSTPEESTTAQPAKAASTEKAAVPTSGVRPVSGANFLKRVEDRVIKLINEERIAKGLNTLEFHEDLRSGARIRSRELFESDTFAHRRPDGKGWETVLQEDVPLVFKIAGENLCTTHYNDFSKEYAYQPDFWFTEWVNSPSHYANILKPEYTHVGVGIYCIEKEGFIYAYATTLFAGF